MSSVKKERAPRKERPFRKESVRRPYLNGARLIFQEIALIRRQMHRSHDRLEALEYDLCDFDSFDVSDVAGRSRKNVIRRLAELESHLQESADVARKFR